MKASSFFKLDLIYFDAISQQTEITINLDSIII